jgi:hypothetical protein
METLLILKDYDPFVLCPKCKNVTDMIDYEDYVNSNCVVFCKNKCGEFLICPTINENDHNGINNIIDGTLPHNTCSTEITLQNAIIYMNNCSVVDIDKYICNKNKYYKINILEITKLPAKNFYKEYYKNYDCDDPSIFDYDKLKSINSATMHLSELKHDYETDHGGVYLHYEAYCKKCNNTYRDFIWGD